MFLNCILNRIQNCILSFDVILYVTLNVILNAIYNVILNAEVSRSVFFIPPKTRWNNLPNLPEICPALDFFDASHEAFALILRIK